MPIGSVVRRKSVRVAVEEGEGARDSDEGSISRLSIDLDKSSDEESVVPIPIRTRRYGDFLWFL